MHHYNSEHQKDCVKLTALSCVTSVLRCSYLGEPAPDQSFRLVSLLLLWHMPTVLGAAAKVLHGIVRLTLTSDIAEQLRDAMP